MRSFLASIAVLSVAIAAPAAAFTIIPVEGANFASFGFDVDEDARVIRISEVWNANTAERALLRFTDYDGSFTGYSVEKSITNLTGAAFTSFSLELLRFDQTASPNDDGLSFGQFDRPRVARTATGFNDLAVDELGRRDYLNWTNGRVASGETVTFTFGLANRRDEGGQFFLAQESNFASVVPEPATWAMLIAGFGMVGFASRKRQRAMRTLD